MNKTIEIHLPSLPIGATAKYQLQTLVSAIAGNLGDRAEACNHFKFSLASDEPEAQAEGEASKKRRVKKLNSNEAFGDLASEALGFLALLPIPRISPSATFAQESVRDNPSDLSSRFAPSSSKPGPSGALQALRGRSEPSVAEPFEVSVHPDVLVRVAVALMLSLAFRDDAAVPSIVVLMRELVVCPPAGFGVAHMSAVYFSAKTLCSASMLTTLDFAVVYPKKLDAFAPTILESGRLQTQPLAAPRIDLTSVGMASGKAVPAFERVVIFQLPVKATDVRLLIQTLKSGKDSSSGLYMTPGEKTAFRIEKMILKAKKTGYFEVCLRVEAGLAATQEILKFLTSKALKSPVEMTSGRSQDTDFTAVVRTSEWTRTGKELMTNLSSGEACKASGYTTCLKRYS